MYFGNMNWGDHLIYDPATGQVQFKDLQTAGRQVVKLKGFAGTMQYVNGLPSCVRVMVKKRRYVVHRIIWEMHNGPIPSNYMVDHINGNPFDNRIENLRLATRSQNAANSRVRRTKKIKLKGVYRASENSYGAQITARGRVWHIGSYPTPELAHAAYCERAKMEFGDFAKNN